MNDMVENKVIILYFFIFICEYFLDLDFLFNVLSIF